MRNPSLFNPKHSSLLGCWDFASDFGSPSLSNKEKKKFNRVKSRCRESIRSWWFRDGTVKESVRNPGGSSAPSWQTLSRLGVRGVWEDGNCWQHLCACVHMCASAPRRHIWQTWRNNNALLSAGLVPGRGLEARNQVWFSQTSRKRAMTPRIYLHRHTCLSKTRARLHVHRRCARLRSSDMHMPAVKYTDVYVATGALALRLQI